MSEQKILLYVDSQFVSPYAMSAFVTLSEKGIPFEMKKVNLGAQENLQPEYRNLSLTSRVPTLVHGRFHLSESSAISEYLDDAFPGPEYPMVYPQSITERARARQIQAWVRSDFMPLREERSTTVVFLQPTSKPLSEAARASVAQLFFAADTLLGRNAKNLFSEWCIADTDLALMINRLLLNGDEVPEKLMAYARYQWQRPTVQRWVKQERARP